MSPGCMQMPAACDRSGVCFHWASLMQLLQVFDVLHVFQVSQRLFLLLLLSAPHFEPLHEHGNL